MKRRKEYMSENWFRSEEDRWKRNCSITRWKKDFSLGDSTSHCCSCNRVRIVVQGASRIIRVCFPWCCDAPARPLLQAASLGFTTAQRFWCHLLWHMMVKGVSRHLLQSCKSPHGPPGIQGCQRARREKLFHRSLGCSSSETRNVFEICGWNMLCKKEDFFFYCPREQNLK